MESCFNVSSKLNKTFAKNIDLQTNGRLIVLTIKLKLNFRLNFVQVNYLQYDRACPCFGSCPWHIWSGSPHQNRIRGNRGPLGYSFADWNLKCKRGMFLSNVQVRFVSNFVTLHMQFDIFIFLVFLNVQVSTKFDQTLRCPHETEYATRFKYRTQRHVLQKLVKSSQKPSCSKKSNAKYFINI